ncbi:hypothetical protein SAMN05446927_3849 [Caballeronia arationis]|uniref:Cyanate hydratase N-terminal domain-containing protein n=1 Tax=Caballeronia arationis TaxID=1777142 RepID=A0A7Z7I7B9_9BURK|nr:hypothetical protein [Caballeronia arationis]SOE80614.1 hypothetical protein SAMN05446927_3849 [Caballeronia arationis]
MLQTLVSPTAREQLTDKVLASKASKGLSWQELTEGTGLSLVFLTAALLGQHPISKEAAETVCRRLELDDDAVAYFGERDHRFRFNVISESGGR